MDNLKFDKNLRYDLIWCEVEQAHILVLRDTENLEEFSRHFSGVAKGTPMTIAGVNGLIVPEIKPICDVLIDRANAIYDDFHQNGIDENRVVKKNWKSKYQ